jgi:hypothetical protein
MTKYKYVVIASGTEIEGLERANQVSIRDAETGRIDTYSKNYFVKFDEFEIDVKKLQTDAIYNNYIATLEMNEVIARKDAEYSNAQLMTINTVKGNFKSLNKTLEAKHEVLDFYTSLLTAEVIETYIESTKPKEVIKK